MKSLATFGAGCFWGVESLFERQNGVIDAKSGYMGGSLDNPSYEDVCTGTTGHAEVVEVEFDNKIITYENLLDIFWRLHDPTTPNQQGPNFGTQYRSAIFYHTEEQKILAMTALRELTQKKIFDRPIITEISPVTTFYLAEEYHQNYYQKKYAMSTGPICHILRDKI